MNRFSVFFIIFSALAWGGEFQSPSNQSTLIELYTSEGCSSCPPADRWLSSLKNADGLWKQFVPLGLHVDYWNYLGWKDRFSTRDFTQRQRNYAQEWNNNRVYTPGFVANGKEWRGFYKGEKSPPKGKPNVGTLKLNISEKKATLKFKPTDTLSKSLIGSIALMTMGESTNVKSGENSGRTLKHDFSVIHLESMPLKLIGVEYVGSTPLPSAVKYQSVAGWVSPKGSQSPIQATGGHVK